MSRHVAKGLYKRDPAQFAWMKEPWTCPKCHETFTAGAKGTHGRWCGKHEVLFWSKVNRTDGCWLYEGTISFEGYGYFNMGSGPRREQWQAHRYAWTILNGEIPADKCLLHHCDIRNCVNPAHLYLGDRQDNANDKMARGRNRHRYSPVETLLWPDLSVRVKDK